MDTVRLLSFGELLFDCFGDTHTLGGAPLNFAAYAALLGAEVDLASAVGTDALGEEALRAVRALGIGTDTVARHREHGTGRSIVSLGEDGSPTYSLLRDVAYDYIEPTPKERTYDVFYFGTLALRSRHNRRTLQAILASHSFREVITDLNIRPPFYSEESIRTCLGAATVAKISDEELPTVTEALFGKRMEPDTAAARLMAAYPHLHTVLITLGAQGALAYTDKGRYACPAVPVHAISTVGAGDSFAATFLMNRLKGKDIPAALQAASAVAAYVVSQTGAIPSGIREHLAAISF